MESVSGGARWIYQAIVIAVGLIGIAWLLAGGRRLPPWLHVTAALAVVLVAAFLGFLASRGMAFHGPEFAFLLVAPAVLYLSYGFAKIIGDVEDSPAAGAPAPGASRAGSNALLDRVSGDALTSDEESRAARVAVYCLNAHGTSPNGWPDAFLGTVSHGLTRDEVFREMERRPLQAGWDEFKASGPASLLTQYRHESINTKDARARLARVAAGERHETMAPSLSEDERAQAAAMQVYYVYYEDRFHHGGGGDSFAVAICRTREDAEAERNRRGREVRPGGDGYEVVGPAPLSGDHRAEVVRKVLRAFNSNKQNVFVIPSELW